MNQYERGSARITHPNDQPAVYITPIVPMKVPADVWVAAIDAPPYEWDSPLAVFEDTLTHEQKVTGMINNLVEIAGAEHDHATHIFLQWFVTDPAADAERAGGVLEQLRLIKEDKSGLIMIDRELLKRAAPSEFAGAQ